MTGGQIKPGRSLHRLWYLNIIYCEGREAVEDSLESKGTGEKKMKVKRSKTEFLGIILVSGFYWFTSYRIILYASTSQHFGKRFQIIILNAIHRSMHVWSVGFFWLSSVIKECVSLKKTIILLQCGKISNGIRKLSTLLKAWKYSDHC